MDINYFDIVVSAIILLLGLKGIINGFFKELFGLIGIIGGIFIASRFGDEVGRYLSDLFLNLQNDSAISFTGFLATLAVFWAVMIVLGYGFKKLSSMSGLGPIDRLFGFIFGAGKFFLIAAVITFAIHNVKALQSSVDSLMKTSILFPVLVETGGFIMKMDPTNITKDMNDSIQESVDKTQEKIEDSVKETVSKAASENIEKIKQEVQEN
jgi:membrane protein required for colicin V production